MKTITFTYTKADGKVSERTLLAFVVPGDKYAGIDLSELHPVDAASFVREAQIIHDEYLESLKHLQGKFDLNHSYRQFVEERMSDISVV